MDFVDCISNNFNNAIIKRCSESRCRLRLDGLNCYIILKGEKVCRNKKICDCIIFTEENNIHIIGVVELKSKTVHANKVKEKLEEGSKIALDVLKECVKMPNSLDFYHIVLAKRWSTSEFRMITSLKIWINGKRYDIIPKKCGTSLAELISSLR
jgi:hypothetical protein